MDEQDPVVLVVDDEPRLADLFATWLRASCGVKTAYGGEEALEEVDESVDVVLLDRRMPGLSGDDVLEEIQDRGLDCRVVMVTAVDPDFDIIEMGFDDYLVKPVSKDELDETVQKIYDRADYDQKMQEYYSLVSKKAVLEAEKSAPELEDSSEYAQLQLMIDELQSEVDNTVGEMSSHEDFASAFRDLPGDDAELPENDDELT